MYNILRKRRDEVIVYSWADKCRSTCSCNPIYPYRLVPIASAPVLRTEYVHRIWIDPDPIDTRRSSERY